MQNKRIKVRVASTKNKENKVDNPSVLISIPKWLLDEAEIKEGDMLQFGLKDNKIIIEKVEDFGSYICSGNCDGCPVKHTECDDNCMNCPCKEHCDDCEV